MAKSNNSDCQTLKALAAGLAHQEYSTRLTANCWASVPPTMVLAPAAGPAAEQSSRHQAGALSLACAVNKGVTRASSAGCGQQGWCTHLAQRVCPCRSGCGVWQHGEALGCRGQAPQVTAAAVGGSLPAADTGAAGVTRPLPCGGSAVIGKACAGRSPTGTPFNNQAAGCSVAVPRCGMSIVLRAACRSSCTHVHAASWLCIIT